jgi:VCBS repeat-containing protein
VGNVITGDTGAGADSDPDGDDLVVSEVNGDAANVGVPVAGSDGGLFTVNPDGTVSFDPNGDFESLAVGETATTEITYTISDGNGGTDTATVTINVGAVNDGPDAVEDTVSGDEDQPITGNLLDNDTDVDGDTLTVIDNTDPSNGTVTVNPDGTYEYTPNPDYNNDYFWLKTKGLRGMVRGGYWNNKTDAGIYSLYAVTPPSSVEPGVGFRCVK